MKILFAASECNPFVKTGGLADVVGSLPPALAALPAQGKSGRIEPVTVLPKYSQIEEARFPMRRLPGKLLVPVGDRVEEGFVWTLSDAPRGKPRVYFIEHKGYFNRPGIYQAADKDFEDNDERFLFFSRALLEFCKLVDFKPDVIHGHDWQAGPACAYLKTLYRTDAFFQGTASLFTIHNIAFQGIFPKQALFLAGFGWQDFTPEKLEYYDQINFLKAGLVYADKVSTVSPAYAREVSANPQFGCGMEGVLKARAADFSGILNGLDYSEWDPAKDREIAAKYSLKSKDLAAKKAADKAALLKAAQFQPDPDRPLIGMVSRLDPQKGFTRLLEVLPKMLAQGQARWVILGSGDKKIRDPLLALAKKYPRQLSMNTSFNNRLAHQIYAGADLFFMPSEFEPCGLSQMIAMKYGTPPVVTPTGGLSDTVAPWNPRAGTGWGFVSEEISTPALEAALASALAALNDREGLETLRRNAMSQDLSWGASARKYADLYRSALKSLDS